MNQPISYRLHLLLAIQRAQEAGFARFTAALIATYNREFPSQ